MKKFILFIMLFVCSMGIFLFYKFRTFQEIESVEVLTEKAKYKDISPKISIPAKIIFGEILTLYTKEGGVVNLKVAQGDNIKEGQVLSAIILDKLTEYKRKEEIESQRRKVEDLETLLKSKERELEETRALYPEGVISKKELESITQEFSQKKCEYQNAVKSYEILNMKYNPSNLIITSPINGRVFNCLVENKTYVNENSPIFKVVDFKRLKVKIFVNEYDVEKVKNSMKAILKLDIFPEKRFELKSDKKILPFANEKGQFEMELSLKEYHEIIKPNMSAFVEFILQTGKKTLVVPIESVHKVEDKQIVYLIRNNKAKIQEVKTGISDEVYIEIKEGLNEGEEIITIPYGEVYEDSKILRLKE